MVEVILFDWGTYNGLSKLRVAAALGMKLTEVPPRDFSSRRRGEDYFREYGEFARKAFTTVTAHAPYYNVVSTNREVMERSWRALIAAARMARLAGAEVYNVHLGWRAYMDSRDLDLAAEFLKKLLSEVDGITVSVEIPYTRLMLGLWDEVKALREAVGGERLIASVQLENAWMLEKGVYQTGAFEAADRETDESFWTDILRRTLSLGESYLSLRFSQVIGFALGRRILKKRVPLGRGYPSLAPLARALARFMVREVWERGLQARMHIIYTGPPETKYRDSLRLYTAVMEEAVEHLR